MVNQNPLQVIANQIAPGSQVRDPAAFAAWIQSRIEREQARKQVLQQQQSLPPENQPNPIMQNGIQGAGARLGAIGRGALGLVNFAETVGKTAAGSTAVAAQRFIPGEQELERNIRLAREQQGDRGFSLGAGAQAVRQGYNQTDLPSASLDLIPGRGINLPGDATLNRVDFGVKGALEMVTDPTNLIPLPAVGPLARGVGRGVGAGLDAIPGGGAIRRAADVLPVGGAAAKGPDDELTRGLRESLAPNDQLDDVIRADAATVRQAQPPKVDLPKPIDVEVEDAIAGRTNRKPRPVKTKDFSEFTGAIDQKTGRTVAPESNIFGIADEVEKLNLGVSRGDRIAATIRGAVPVDVARAPVVRRVLRTGSDEHVDKAYNLMEAVGRNAKSRSVATVSEFGTQFRRAFNPDKTGRIQSLDGVVTAVPGAPSLEDVAAHLDSYRPYLTREQLTFLEYARETVAPYRRVAEKAGMEFGTRTDIEPGGFYLPRLVTKQPTRQGEDALAASLRQDLTRRSSAEFEAKFTSVAEGWANGYEYASAETAVGNFIETVGRRTGQKTASNYLATATTADGTRLGLTAKQLTFGKNPELVRRMEGIRATRDRFVSLIGSRDKALQKAIFAITEDPEVDDIAGLISDLTKQTVVRRGSLKGTDYRDLVKARDQLVDELRQLRFKYNTAKEAATKGRKQITEFPELSQRFYEARMAARSTQLAERGKGGFGGSLLDDINEINSAWKGVQATGDDSAIGIQTLIVAANKPKSFLRAVRANVDSFLTPNGQGDALARFNERSLIPAQDYADYGVRILKAGEFDVTSEGIERLPGIGRILKRTNRAFAGQSNIARLEWTDELVREQLMAGRTLDQIKADGTLTSIAKMTNAATGIVDGNHSVANLITFSAKFFDARLRTLSRAFRGLDIDAPLDVIPGAGRYTGRFGINPVARLEDKAARRSILRMIGFFTTATVAINETPGPHNNYQRQDTDFRPYTPDGKFNGNFMRIRAFNRDYSLFGSWDSMVRFIGAAAVGDVKNSVRSFASAPGASLALDLVMNEDFGGRKIYRTSTNEFGQPIKGPDKKPLKVDKGDQALDIFTRVTQSFVPFSADEQPETMRQLVQAGTDGRYNDLAINATTAFNEFIAIKSSPLSQAELRALLQDPAISQTTRAAIEEELKVRKYSYDAGAYSRNPISRLLGNEPGRGTPAPVYTPLPPSQPRQQENPLRIR